MYCVWPYVLFNVVKCAAFRTCFEYCHCNFFVLFNNSHWNVPHYSTTLQQRRRWMWCARLTMWTHSCRPWTSPACLKVVFFIIYCLLLLFCCGCGRKRKWFILGGIISLPLFSPNLFCITLPGMAIAFLNDPERQHALAHLRKQMMLSNPQECMLCKGFFDSSADVRCCPW